ncbi:phosphatase PAP2 family protein [Rosenbergiella australiborealis]|uniref:phosphatase PAP2 family protein n=1 Tax=Rosenbergiella australiborealis TaxID=1544696 RepID=UPI001F4EBD19|nr:phosphatase PAP2 family protein [Rosenbergiella australiborealis]
MRQQFTKLTLGAMGLLVPVLVVVFLGWHWSAYQVDSSAYVFYCITQTVSRPWGILTSVILGIVLYYCRGSFPQHLPSFIILVLIIVGGGQGIKTLLKPFFAEPRPYVVALMNEMHADPSNFYQHTGYERRQLVSHSSRYWPSIPQWQRNHWQHETGFSFPSGHSFFVASWLLLFYSLVAVKRYWPILIVVTLWAWAVMWSRMLLGMHWPRDIIASILIAWIFSVLVLCVYSLFSRHRT